MTDRKKINVFTEKLKTAALASAPTAASLRIKIFADGADKEALLHHYRNPAIAGFTTNPTLMKKAGVSDYQAFAIELLNTITDRPISFEVFSDDFDEMEEQAHIIASWGKNVYVKIPITNTKGDSSIQLVKRLSAGGVKLNVTAITSYDQVSNIVPVLAEGCSSIVSVFAGRIADAGQDPLPIMKKCIDLLSKYPHIELLWASPRELYNVVQADKIGCHIITVTDDILKKLPMLGRDLKEVSLDTVRMFYNDAHAAGYNIKSKANLTGLVRNKNS